MSVMLFYSQSAAPPFELNGKHFKSKMITNARGKKREKNFSVFPVLISQLQLEPVFPLYFQRHYAVPTVVYESPSRANIGGVSLPAERWNLVGIWSGYGRKLDHSVCMALEQLGEVVINNTENLSGACCTIKITFWMFWMSSHPRLPSASSNHIKTKHIHRT